MTNPVNSIKFYGKVTKEDNSISSSNKNFVTPESKNDEFVSKNKKGLPIIAGILGVIFGGTTGVLKDPSDKDIEKFAKAQWKKDNKSSKEAINFFKEGFMKYPQLSEEQISLLNEYSKTTYDGILGLDNTIMLLKKQIENKSSVSGKPIEGLQKDLEVFNALDNMIKNTILDAEDVAKLKKIGIPCEKKIPNFRDVLKYFLRYLPDDQREFTDTLSDDKLKRMVKGFKDELIDIKNDKKLGFFKKIAEAFPVRIRAGIKFAIIGGLGLSAIGLAISALRANKNKD